MEISYTDLIGFEAITADNKNLGKVIAIDETKQNQYFIALKKGLLKDEEFRIPSNSITTILVNESKLTINLKEDEVKHGYELLNQRDPSSKLISGKSNSSFSIPFQKDKIKYQSLSSDLEKHYPEKPDETVKVDKYICEMCQDQFQDISEFESHRKNKHSGPIGI
jgi:hypothetical protein